MLQKRQSAISNLSADRRSQITTLSEDYRAGHVVPSHFHDRDQLVYATRGVMTVRTREGTWVVPAHRAVWIPAQTLHSITMSGMVEMRTLYLRPRLAKTLARECCVLNVTALLRDLILHACSFARLHKTIRRQAHVIDLIIDQLEAIQRVPLQLPNPSDPRALRIASLLLSNPGDRGPLIAFCKQAGVGKRTLERLFLDDLGMTLGKWRQQLRLMQAMRFLAEGAKVTHAAMEAGYSTPSAFISAFRKTFGTTPARYFRAGPDSAPSAVTRDQFEHRH